MSGFLLTTRGTGGDVQPFVALAACLTAAGYPVTVLTHAPFGPDVRAAGARFVPLDDEAGHDAFQRRTPELMRARRPRELREFYLSTGLFEQIEVETREISAVVRDSPGTVVVARHTSSLAAMIAAEAHDCPLALVALSPTQLMTAPVAALHLAHALGPEVNRIRAKAGLGPVTSWARWLGRADLVVGLWPDWFDAAGTPAPEGTLLTGFPLADGALPGRPPAVAGTLGDTRDTVLVSGGTGRMVHDDFYPVAVQAVAATGRRGLVVTPHPDQLPEPLPAGITHLPSLDFPALMPAFGAVLHHGGIGTISRALAAGVPQVLMADGADRVDNGRRLEQLGLARSLERPDWSAETVAAALTAATTPAVPAAPVGPVRRLAELVLPLATDPAPAVPADL